MTKPKLQLVTIILKHAHSGGSCVQTNGCFLFQSRPSPEVRRAASPTLIIQHSVSNTLFLFLSILRIMNTCPPRLFRVRISPETLRSHSPFAFDQTGGGSPPSAAAGSSQPRPTAQRPPAAGSSCRCRWHLDDMGK